MSKRKRFLLVSLVTVTFVSVVLVFSPALALMEHYIETPEQEQVIRRFCAERWDEGKHADNPVAMAECYKTKKWTPRTVTIRPTIVPGIMKVTIRWWGQTDDPLLNGPKMRVK